MFGEIEWIKKHNCFAQCSLLHTAYWDHNTMPRLELTCERQRPLRCTFTSGIEFIALVAEDYFWFSSFVLVFALWKTNAARIHPQSVCVVIGLVSYTFTVVQSAQRVQGCHQIENDNAAHITGWLFTISASDHVICGAAFGLRYRKMLDKLAHAHTNT